MIFVFSLIAAKSWRILIWTASVLVITAVTYIYFHLSLPDVSTSETTAAAFMCGIAVSLLFGGVITGIHIARQTHHMAGLSLEAEDEEQEQKE